MSNVTKQRDVTVIRLEPVYDSLDDQRIGELRSLLLEQAEKAEPPKLLIDMQATEFIGSSFIEVLFRAWKRLADRGGHLAVGGVSPFCQAVFQAARVDQVFPIYGRRDEALERLEAL